MTKNIFDDGEKELQELYKPVCEILWNDWDPIGVNKMSNADDEYDSYAPKICRYLSEGADEFKLAAYLRQVKTSSMGIEGDDENDKQAARKLFNLYQNYQAGK